MLNNNKKNILFLSVQHTIYKLALHLPIALPLDGLTSLTPFEDNIMEKVQYVLAQVYEGKRPLEPMVFSIQRSCLSHGYLNAVPFFPHSSSV